MSKLRPIDYDKVIKALVSISYAVNNQKGSHCLCDFMEIYRYMIDNFSDRRATKFHKNDFVAVTDFTMKLKQISKRIYLKKYEADRLAGDLNSYFDS